MWVTFLPKLLIQKAIKFTYPNITISVRVSTIDLRKVSRHNLVDKIASKHFSMEVLELGTGISAIQQGHNNLIYVLTEEQRLEYFHRTSQNGKTVLNNM